MDDKYYFGDGCFGVLLGIEYYQWLCFHLNSGCAFEMHDTPMSYMCLLLICSL